ncbi:PREDICTED: LOC18784477 [Prunus dulcis]|uniref:PREDICTED: LOC18784477 n=1 Tax=Prunus dulcis TaxID=3755 RepID=A0A5E4GB59_PRUDU|nr:PREDICTED: LOC18784477 [Prunus dulcis]
MNKPHAPKLPRRTMLRDYKFTIEDEDHEALNVSSVENWENEQGLTVGTIPPQAWSVRIPSFMNATESKLVRIPKGQENPDVSLTKKVTHEQQSKKKHDPLGKGKAPMVTHEDGEEEDEEDDEQEEEDMREMM